MTGEIIKTSGVGDSSQLSFGSGLPRKPLPIAPLVGIIVTLLVSFRNSFFSSTPDEATAAWVNCVENPGNGWPLYALVTNGSLMWAATMQKALSTALGKRQEEKSLYQPECGKRG